MFVLEIHETSGPWVLHQVVGYTVIMCSIGILEKDPADVRMPESSGRVIRVFSTIDLIVMLHMIGNPTYHAIFDGKSSTNRENRLQ
jgi:hypothetical protein